MGQKSGEIKIEGDTPWFNEPIKRAQKAFRSKHWRDFKEIFEHDTKDLLEEFDLFGNTAIHIAARSDDPQLLKHLLELLCEEERWLALTKKDYQGNTLLHEVALCCKVEKMADVVLDLEKETAPQPPVPAAEEEEEKGRPLLEWKNKAGETPLFKAAKFGSLEVLKRMANHIQPQGGMKEVHLHSNTENILHACLNGQHFHVALWLFSTMDCSSLAQQRNKRGLTCLQLLARMPKAFYSYYSTSEGFFNKRIYELLPTETSEVEGCDRFDQCSRPSGDSETGQRHGAKLSPTSGLSRINYAIWNCLAEGLSRINYAVWECLAEVYQGIGSIWKAKKKHESAYRVAEFLVKNDYSWQIRYEEHTNEDKTPIDKVPPVLYNVAKRRRELKWKEKWEQKKKHQQENKKHLQQEKKNDHKNHTPMLVAASNGITEIILLFREEHPQSINHTTENGENILHIALMHRRVEIFNLLQNYPEGKSLASQITRDDNRTALHKIATMDYYRGSAEAGAAFQLQEELNLYKRVEEMVPEHLHLYCDDTELTAGDLLDVEHDKMLADAQSWMKQTAESCSTVAVLVATVVFAAAYAIPGGFENGTPSLLSSPLFSFFTVMDIVALAFSLASVVMFLSILTSPFELWDFHKSLPQKMSMGLTFLFLALITTMLAFSATILLTIRFQWKNWTSTLVYSAAFFPVSIFALFQFPLYNELPQLLYKAYKKTIEAIPIYKVLKYCFCRRNRKAVSIIE